MTTEQTPSVEEDHETQLNALERSLLWSNDKQIGEGSVGPWTAPGSAHWTAVMAVFFPPFSPHLCFTPRILLATIDNVEKEASELHQPTYSYGQKNRIVKASDGIVW